MKIKVYHSSPQINRPYIRAKGLVLSGREKGRIQYSPRIFLSINKEDMGMKLSNYKENDLWEIEVDEEDLKVDEFSKSENHFYIEKRIEARYVKLIETPQPIEQAVPSDI